MLFLWSYTSRKSLGGRVAYLGLVAYFNVGTDTETDVQVLLGIFDFVR